MKFRSGLLWLALGAALPLCSRACGPDFPADLLGDRAATLDQLPEGAFDFEAQHLVAAPAPLHVVERADWLWNEQKITRDSIERGWWASADENIAALRAAPSAAAAYSASSGLPEELRRYFAGAAAFAKHDLVAAAQRFHSVLELPATERTHYGLWAQYMLGRIAVAQDDSAAAIVAFESVRTLVAQGADDPLGLAATSLGDEARVHLRAGGDAAAVALYAQQTALGSAFGRSSLLQIARQVIGDPARLEHLIADPLGQRLMTVYLFTRSGELSEAPADSESSPADNAKAQAAGAKRIEQFLDAVERGGLDKVAGADRLAALAYRSGRYDLAAKLAALDESGLAWWVRAKLALRDGDANAAAQAYAQAAKAFPADENWGSGSYYQAGVYEPIKPQCRIEGERGTLALSRGEYVSAMEHLYKAASEYWPDAAYIAERVLNVDELKAFVDAHVAKAAAKVANTGGDNANADDSGGYGIPAAPATALRALLARRLLRTERYDEAIGYFDDAALKLKAQSYADARHTALRGGRVEQATAWYAAAHAARIDGIDLLGYELDPDYQIYSGDFDLGGHIGYGSDAETSAQSAVDSAETPNTSMPSPRQDMVVPKKLAGPDEAARVSASRAVPLQRFHYRYTAVDFAQKSADLLPPRTQAFAAVLCHATNWLIDRDPNVAHKLYLRYVKQGAYVSWGADFGRSCPEPDFAGAALRLRAERIAWWKHFIRHNAGYAAIAAGAMLIGFVLLRRQRRAAGAKSRI